MITKLCERCAIEFLSHACHKTRFCSRSCAKSDRLGPLNNGWKGGRRWHKQSKCWTIYRNGKHVLEHRMIIEDFLGRKLVLGEVVHHVNHDRSDNRIENLMLMNRGEHIGLHNRIAPRHVGRVRDEKGRFTWQNSV